MDQTMKRLYFGLGKNDHVLPQKIIGRINDITHTKNIPIGRIDLFPDFSYVDVEESFIPMILECFADPRKNPQGIVVEVAKEQPKREKKEKRNDKRDEKRTEERPKYKVEHSRDGHEWLDPDWREHLDDIDVFVDDDDVRPSRKKRSEERGFGSKKESSVKKEKGPKKGKASNSRKEKSPASKKESRSSGFGFRSSDYDIGPRSSKGSKDSGRGRRGAARHEEQDYYSPKRRSGHRK